MKKSSAIRLVLLGSTGLTLAACSQKPPSDATFFSKVEDCIAVLSELARSRPSLSLEKPDDRAPDPTPTGVPLFIVPLITGVVVGACHIAAVRSLAGRAMGFGTPNH